MLIGELSVDTVVTITVSLGKKAIKFESQVVAVSDSDLEYIRGVASSFGFTSFIPIELVKENNKIISFKSNKIICYLTAQSDGKSYLWKNIKIVRVIVPDSGSYHVAFCNDDIDSFNRREEFRLWLGCDVLIRINDSRVPHNGMIKDLSGHGGGFILDNKYDVKEGDILHIQFYDSVKNKLKGEWEEVLYSAEYTVVRIVPMKNEKVLLGCTIYDDNDSIIKFVVKKQRERLSSGGKSSLYHKERDSKLADSLKDNRKN